MRKRSTAALIAAMLVVAVGFFASFFFLFAESSGEQYTITLPGQGSAVIDPSPEIGQANRDQLQIVEIDRTNFLAVLQSLQRPETYQLQSETTYYYRDSSSTLKSQLWKGQPGMRISQMNAQNEQAQQVLLTDNWVYVWSADSEVARFEKQSRDADLYRRTPTYEDLLKLSAEEILEGRVEELEGQLCLYAKTKDTLTGEEEQWYILAENGLLLYAEGTLDGQMTYQTRMTQLQLEMEDSQLFLLPDGSQPE